jgi:hypothetical protein
MDEEPAGGSKRRRRRRGPRATPGGWWRWPLRVLGALAAAVFVVYLIGAWLQAGGRTEATFRGGWVRLQPTWLYPVVLLLAGLVAALVVAVVIARKQAAGEAWRAQVRAKADYLENQLEFLLATEAARPPPLRRLKPDAVEAVKTAVTEQLRKARDAAAPESRHPKTVGRMVQAWSASQMRAAYLSLHAAEVAMIPLLSDDEIEARIPEALARLDKLAATDQRRLAAEVRLRARGPVRGRRAEYTTAVRLGYGIKDAQHAQLQSFRNIVYGTTFALSVVVIAMCLIGASFPDAIPLCFTPTPTTQQPGTVTTTTLQPPRPTTTVQEEDTICPSEEQPPEPSTAGRRLPAPGDVTLVALFGLLGGALSGAFTIRNLQGTSTPYSVPVALSLLKLPAGALTAIVGILLVRGEFVPGLSQLDNQPQILAYAFIFGIAQLAVTRYVDDRGQEVMRRVPSKAAPEREKEAADGERAPPEAAVAAAAKRKRRPRLSRR